MDENTLRRLAFIKGLYGLARRQSEDRGPLAVAAVLTCHDAVELWLRLAAETVGIQSDSQEFMKYWDAFGAKLDNPLPGKERMRRLNKARVNLKHYGIMPSAADVQELTEATATFLQEATSQLFAQSFTELSLLDLVSDKEIAALLREASTELAESRVPETLDALAKAFYCLRKYLGDQLIRVPGRPPISVYRRSPPRLTGNNRDDQLPIFAQHMEQNFSELRSRVSMLELGVDVSRFRRFSAFVPGIDRSDGGKWWVYRGLGRPALEATVEEAQECFDFLLETAIMLADYMEAPPRDEPPPASGGDE